MRNVPHRLNSLNTWSPVGVAVCQGCGMFLRGRVLLEEVCHWGQALPCFPFLSLCFLCLEENVISHLPAPLRCLSSIMNSLSQEPVAK